MKVVILAGGPGSRLWPLSTVDRPKQFLPLLGDQTLLQYTFGHMARHFDPADIYIQTRAGHEHFINEQLPDFPASKIILTPVPKDNYADVLWATNHLGADPDEPILFKSVDLFMDEPDTFLDSLEQAVVRYHTNEPAITLICVPVARHNPNSGFMLADENRSITQFIEKPSKQLFSELLSSQTVYRSLFIFILTKNNLTNALTDLEQDWAKLGVDFLSRPPSTRRDGFIALPPVNISKTLFSHSKALKVDSVTAKSSDFGTYAALYDAGSKDVLGNVIFGNVKLEGDCRRNFISNFLPSPLIVVGAHDAVIVQTESGSVMTSLKLANSVGQAAKQL
jgi:mannose-1-phosphate guanylyltransferase